MRRVVSLSLIVFALLLSGCDVAGLVQSIDASSQKADKLISSLAASDNKK